MSACRWFSTVRPDVDILIPLAPVRGQAALQPQDALGDEQKLQVAAPADHLPGAVPPRVGLLQQKVGAKAGVHPRAGRNQIAFVPPAAHGEVKVLVEKDLGGVLAVCAVDAVDIAVLTALAAICGSRARDSSLPFLPLLASFYGLYCTTLSLFFQRRTRSLNTQKKTDWLPARACQSVF